MFYTQRNIASSGNSNLGSCWTNSSFGEDIIYTRIALEVMLSILLRCPKTSEADVDGIAVEVCSRNAKLQHETD